MLLLNRAEFVCLLPRVKCFFVPFCDRLIPEDALGGRLCFCRGRSVPFDFTFKNLDLEVRTSLVHITSPKPPGVESSLYLEGGMGFFQSNISIQA